MILTTINSEVQNRMRLFEVKCLKIFYKFYDLTAVIFCWRVRKVVGVDLDGKKKHDKSQKDALRLKKKKKKASKRFQLHK